MTNRLASETSPYLLQHAHNPVDWFPWGNEAFATARSEDKPILLSIGYSACHWCHVMAHESFEDPDIAAIMNAYFVNIKVDREERPDLDQIYQSAHVLLAERGGGWPLTMFLTPDQRPFFAGTYFPKTARYGLPGFGDVLLQVAQLYRSRRSDIERQNDSLTAALRHSIPSSPVGADELDAGPLKEACEELERDYDPVYGGFGTAPKFPRPYELEFLLTRREDPAAISMAVATLEKMAEGGLNDQLGGGFFRYSVDERWLIPHFEKMLYDNGPLIGLFAEAYRITGRGKFRDVVLQTAEWATREMQSPDGGFYSSLDADSLEGEGRYYVWKREEVESIVSPSAFEIISAVFGLDRPPNFEHDWWHLHVAREVADVAAASDATNEDMRRIFQDARRALLRARQQRLPPGRDEKIIASWNGLMIKGLAQASRLCEAPDLLVAAQRGMDFIQARMWSADCGRLHSSFKDGVARLNGYLDDYAFLLDASIELMQSGFREADLRFAIALADALLEHFEDTDQGGFFFTPHDHETLFLRPKPGTDSAMPSGNGVAAYALQRLAHLTGDMRYLGAAERTLKLFYPAMKRHSIGLPTLLRALGEWVSPPTVAVLRGPAEQLDAWRAELSPVYSPDVIVLALDAELTGLPAGLNKPARAQTCAWVCRGAHCLEPVENVAKLVEIFKTATVS